MRKQENPSPMNAWFCARRTSKCHSSSCYGLHTQYWEWSCLITAITKVQPYWETDSGVKLPGCSGRGEHEVQDLLTTAVKFYRLHVGLSCWLRKREDLYFNLKRGLVLLSPFSSLIQHFKNTLVRYKIETLGPVRERSQQRIVWGRRKEDLYARLPIKQPVWADSEQEGKGNSICSKMQTGK